MHAPFTHVWPVGQVPQQSDSFSTQRVEPGHFTWEPQHWVLATQRPSQTRVPDGQTHICELHTRPPVQSALTQQPPPGFTHSHRLVLVLHVWF
jgi:hypothetical protein